MAISKIIAQNIRTSQTLTNPSGAAINATYSVKRVGNMITFHLGNITSLDNAASITLNNFIPEGYRPTETVYFNVPTRGNSSTIRIIGTSINSAGTVTMYNYGTSITGATSINSDISWSV